MTPARAGSTSDRATGVDIRRGGEGRAVLLLNGIATGRSSWDPLRAHLDDRPTVAYDAPGALGRPGPRPPTSITGLARAAVDVLDVAGLDVVDVVGYSFGGAVAQELAIIAPERLRRIVLAATSCGLGCVAGDLEALPRTMCSSGVAIGRPAAWLRLVAPALAFSSWTSIPHLGSIPHDVLVLSGRDDRLVPAANARLLARRIPHAGLLEIDAGHDLFAAAHIATSAHHVRAFFAAADFSTGNCGRLVG